MFQIDVLTCLLAIVLSAGILSTFIVRFVYRRRIPTCIRTFYVVITSILTLILCELTIYNFYIYWQAMGEK